MLFEESGRPRGAMVPTPAERATDEPRAQGRAATVPGSVPVPVLLVTSNVAFSARLRSGLDGSPTVALTVCSAPTTKTPLSRLAAETGARLIVVDADLFANGLVGLAFPADPDGAGFDVLLLFDKLSEAAVRLSLLSRANGCLQSDVTTDGFARAVDAVVHGGELWFPRWMMEPLFDMALAAMAAAGPAQRDPDSALTEREAEVLRLVQRGMTNKQAAGRLGISPNTVKKHLHNALVKRGIQRRRQLFE